MYCLFLLPLQCAWVLMSNDTLTKTSCMLCKEEKPEFCPIVNGKSLVPVALIHPSAWKRCWDNVTVTVRYIYLLAFQYCPNAHVGRCDRSPRIAKSPHKPLANLRTQICV